jgi:glycosyltransferase involved in cell wall biosynthesis
MTKPIRVLEIRCADGPGGGPEKTIILGAAKADPARLAVTVCYLRNQDDRDETIRERALAQGIDFVEVRQRHPIDPRAWQEIARIVRDRRVQIVHAHDYKTDLIALAMGRRGGVVPLTTAHGWTGHSWRERRVYYPADKWLIARFPRVIAVSSQIRQELIEAGTKPERIQTILNGIDPALFRRDPQRVARERQRLGLEAGEFAIGAVGRLEPQKRFDILIEAFAATRGRHPELRLLIAGEGSKREALEREIDSRNLGRSCRLLGHCPDISGFYHAIDLLAQSSDYEGTPNAILEAMALEVPVVATNAGGTGELIEHHVHGLIIPPRDPGALADSIASVLGDPPAAGDRVRMARARVERELSFETRQDKLGGIYERLLGSRHANGASI